MKAPITMLLHRDVKLMHLHAFFYKQHFYKQRQTEIGKKSSNS